jgi:hypothetical protein
VAATNMKATAPTAAPSELAPELAAVVNDAVEEMETLIQRGRLQNDPLRFPIAAEQVFLRAFHQVALDLVLRITSQRVAPVVVPDQEWRRIAVEMSRAGATSLDRMTRRMGFRNGLFVLAALLIALAAGACGGWWWRGAVPVVIGTRAGADRCEDRMDGSRLCWIPVFERGPSR